MSSTVRRVLRRVSLAAFVISFLSVVPSSFSQDSTWDVQTPSANEAAVGRAATTGMAPVTGAASAVTTPRGKFINNSVSFGVVIDESSAMKVDPAIIRAAVKKLVKPMGDEDEAFIVSAKDKPELLQDFTSDPEEISRKLNHLKLKGKASLFDAIMTALNHLDDASNQRTALIVFASGQDDVSSASLDTVRQKLASTGTPVYCIATKHSSWESQGVLQELAASSHGSALFPRRDKDVTDASAEVSRRVFGENALAVKAKPLAPYDVAVVKSIPVANGQETSDFPEGDNVILQKMLVRNLRSKGLFQQVIDATTPDGVDQSKSAGEAQSAALEVMGTVVDYKPATERQARFIRLGGRSALVKVQFLFRDARTGKIVMKSIAEGKVDTGLLGGSPEKVETQAVLRAIDKVLDDIARNR